MANAARQIARLVKQLEEEAAPISELRDLAISDNGRLTKFGVDLLELAKEHGVPQIAMVRILGVTASAVSRRYSS